jgi:hypothetical protein
MAQSASVSEMLKDKRFVDMLKSRLSDTQFPPIIVHNKCKYSFRDDSEFFKQLKELQSKKQIDEDFSGAILNAAQEITKDLFTDAAVPSVSDLQILVHDALEEKCVALPRPDTITVQYMINGLSRTFLLINGEEAMKAVYRTPGDNPMYDIDCSIESWAANPRGLQELDKWEHNNVSVIRKIQKQGQVTVILPNSDKIKWNNDRAMVLSSGPYVILQWSLNPSKFAGSK